MSRKKQKSEKDVLILGRVNYDLHVGANFNKQWAMLAGAVINSARNDVNRKATASQYIRGEYKTTFSRTARAFFSTPLYELCASILQMYAEINRGAGERAKVESFIGVDEK